jgi:uncharacterized zinc-type alcohol dehydrogenase-like protein
VDSNPETTRTVSAYAALSKDAPVEPWAFQQRAMREHDVVFDVLFCGICHTDIHMIGPWGQSFPVVPGHEMVGRVTAVGSEVAEFGPGDVVAVGTIVDSCRKCEPCLAGMESYCVEGPTGAYGFPDRIDGSPTRGGYASSITCDERFVYRVPAGLDPAAVAPLLCAGITTYAPLAHWGIGPGSTVGVIGVGGLGHLGIKFARALGAHVVAFTTSPAKIDDALALGAHEVVVSRDEEQMAAQANRFDFLLDTVSTGYPMTPFVLALKLDGTLCSLGLPPSFDVSPMALATGRRSIASSGSGGTRETKEMLAFCAQHDITADIELVAPTEINVALGRLAANDVKYRFVIDMDRD